MQQITVPVIKSFVHEGRAVPAGGAVTVAPVQAAVLALRGVVSLDSRACRDIALRVEAQAAIEADKDADNEPEPKSKPSVIIDEIHENKDTTIPDKLSDRLSDKLSDKPKRKRRTYRRRDLVAQSS